MSILAFISAMLLAGPQFQKVSFERLPDLQTARGVALVVLSGDEVTVFGGHTTGYKPVETAEYYRGGTWHSVPMTWPHDGGCIAQMPDGRVFLAGGNAEPFGIGQSWGAEIYNPATHSFAPIGIMDRKRSLHSALALPDGKVLIAGNWYGEDGVEAYTPGSGFSSIKPLKPGWCYPYILRSSPEDAIIFGPMNPRGQPSESVVAHLEGDSFSVPMLEEWQPIFNYATSEEEQKIADYTYLILAHRQDRTGAALLKVSGGVFSILELEQDLPVTGPSGDPVFWSVGPQVDRTARLAWIQGNDTFGRIYFARIGYNPIFDGGKASVQLYYSETAEGFPYGKAKLLPDEKMILVGGTAQVPGEPVLVNDNFNTFSSVYLFHLEEPSRTGIPVWAIVVGILLIVTPILIGLLLRRKKTPESAPEEEAEQARKTNADMIAELARLIEEKQLFLRKDLRVADIAKELATNRTYMSLLVNSLTGSGFSDLINGYRIRYAQQLMTEHPEMVHSDVAIASGFSSRTAFLRTFKAKTGLSPTEWKKSQSK